MKFIDGNIEIEVKRNPNTIVLYIDKKEQRRAANKIMKDLKKEHSMFFEKYQFQLKLKEEKIIENTNLVKLSNLQSHYNQSLITIAQLINVDYSATRTGKHKYEYLWKVPEEYKTFKGITLLDKKLDDNYLNKGKYYIITGTLKRGIKEIEEEIYLKKSHKMLGMQNYTFWINDAKETEYAEEEELESFDIPRFPLHCHTKSSMKDAMIDEQRIEQAFETGKIKSFAITDHRETNAFVNYQRYFAKKDYQIIAGLEAEVFDDRNENFNYETDIHNCRRYHLVLINNTYDTETTYKGEPIKVNEGIRAFNTLITEANTKYFSVPSKEFKQTQEANEEFKTYRKPIMSLKKILEYRAKGILKLGSACVMGTVRQFLMRDMEKEMKEYIELMDWVEIHPIHNENFMVESPMFPNITSELDIIKRNRALFEYCKSINKDVIFADDCHVINKKDRILRSLFKKGEIAKINKSRFDKLEDEALEEAVQEMNDDLAEERQPFLHSYYEMHDELRYQGFTDEEIKMMKETEERISMSFPRLQDITIIPKVSLLPEFPGVDSKAEVKRISYEFAMKTWAKNNDYNTIDKEIRDRLELEIKALDERNYEFLYYSAMWLVQQSVAKGYIVGSRGSVGSSLLAHSMGITENNPLKPHYLCESCKELEWIDSEFKYGVDFPNKPCPKCGNTMKGNGLNTAFNNFLGFNHDKVPDIDLNFASEDLDSDYPIQLQVMEELKKIYPEGVSSIRAGTTSRSKEDAILANVLSKVQNIKEMVQNGEIEPIGIANELSGIYMNSGQHAGGIIVFDQEKHPEDESHFDFKYGFGIIRSGEDKGKDVKYVTSIEYKPLEEFAPKLDMLAKSDPSLIKILMEETGTEDYIINKMQYNDQKIINAILDIRTILPNPEDVQELYYSQGTLGIPELGTPFIRGAIELCKPQSFTDIVRVQGLTHGTMVLELAKPLLEMGKKLEEIPWCVRDELFVFFWKKWGLDPTKAFKSIEYIRKGKWKAMPDELKDYLKEKLPDWVYNSVSKIVYLFPSAQ